MPPRDVGASRSSQCDWQDSRSPPSTPVHAHRDPLYRPVLFHPPAPSLSRHSATPACAPLLFFLCRSVSESPSIHLLSLSLLYSYALSIYLIPCVISFSSSSPEIFLCPFLFIFLPCSFFLLYCSIYPYLLLSLSFSLSHSRTSPYSPCRARLLLSLSNPPDTGQAGGHVNIGSANRAPSDVIRVGSRTVRERSRGRKGAFVDPGGRCATDGVGMDVPVGSIYGRCVMQRRD